MKKIINYYLFFLFLAFTCSCVDDKGNYTYQDEKEIMPVEIKEMEQEITIEANQTLTITPEIKGLDNPENYTYEWYVYEYMAVGFAPKRQYIGDTRDLNYMVTLDPGKWNLIFKITDSKRNVFVRTETILNVIATSVDNKGWYILKDNGTETDFDYINPEGEQYNDVLRKKGLQLPGKAVCMEYQNGRYYHNITDEDGNIKTLANQTAFHILSTQEIYTINSKTIELFKDFQAHFYSPVEPCAPQSYFHLGSGQTFMQNAGKLYRINGMSPNIGVLSPITGIYDLYEGGGIPSGSKNCIVYDKKEHSLLGGDTYNNYFTDIPDLTQEETTYSFKNMPYDIVCLGYNIQGSRNGQGYIALKHLESEEGALLRIKMGTSAINSFSVIPAGSRLLHAKMLAPAFYSDFVYFYENNTVYSYENAKDVAVDKKEKEIVSYSEGENVTFVKQVYQAKTTNTPLINQLAVLTTKDGKWKLYIYDLLGESNPEIKQEPVATYEGEGNGRFLLFRSN